MAHEVEWSPAALDDVDAIAAYIARDSPHYAAAEVQRLIEASRRLAHFPELGRSIPEFGDPALREVLGSSYRMLYRVSESVVVTIAAVVHQKQSFEDAVARRTPSRGA